MGRLVYEALAWPHRPGEDETREWWWLTFFAGRAPVLPAGELPIAPAEAIREFVRVVRVRLATHP